MLLHVWVRCCSSNNAIELIAVTEGMNDALNEFVRSVIENLEPEDGEENLERGANMP